MCAGNSIESGSDLLVDRYHSGGYCFPVGAVPVSMATDAAGRIAALIKDPPAGLNYPRNLKAHLLFDWVYKLSVHPTVLDAEKKLSTPIFCCKQQMYLPKQRTAPNISIGTRMRTTGISIHHCLLAHSTGTNQTANPRIGLGIRYMSPHVRQTEGPAMSSIPVSGEDRHGYYKVDAPTTDHPGPDAIRSHARSMAPHAAENYATA